MPGAHNLQNATMAVAMAKALGVDVERAIAAMKTFRGVERRLQLVSQPLNISTSQPAPAVYDDYAHNPEKLHAMWTTLAEKYPAGICVIWRPHGYAPLRKMMDALAAMFAETVRPQDKLLLLPVYDAGGTTDRSVNSDALIAAIEAARKASGARSSSASRASSMVSLVADLDAAYDWCAAHRGEFGAFVTCGARDPGLPVLARRLSEM